MGRKEGNRRTQHIIVKLKVHLVQGILAGQAKMENLTFHEKFGFLYEKWEISDAIVDDCQWR